jgi:hypothetical protein
VRERRPPFSPEDVVIEFSAILNSYRISDVTGDRYAGEWPRERFREHGIAYEPAANPKSDLYRDLLPAINSRMVDLLDDARLFAQIVGLERRTARGGRDSIDHAPGAHDDVANAAAGVIAALASSNYELRQALAAQYQLEQVSSGIAPTAASIALIASLLFEHVINAANSCGARLFDRERLLSEAAEVQIPNVRSRVATPLWHRANLRRTWL